MFTRSIKVLSIVSLVAVVSACGGGREEEFVVVDPEPISVEPTFTGKYK